MLLISEADVNMLLGMRDTISCLEEAFHEQSGGNVAMPSRQVLKAGGSSAVVRLMSAAIPKMNALGAKLLLGAPATRQLGRTYFVTAIFDPEDASLQALVAANRLTQLRTGAASGIATKHLAKKSSKTLGVLGAGIQGYGQLEGVTAGVSVESVTAFDLDSAKLDSLVLQAKEKLGLDVKKAKKVEELYETDVLCTATPATKPAIFGDQIAPGTHINAVGSNAPTRQEIDSRVLQRSRIFVDKLEQVMEEAGDIVIPLKAGEISAEKIAGNICDVVTGKIPGRESESQITLFKSVGIALEDITTARIAYEKALKAGIGTQVSFA